MVLLDVSGQGDAYAHTSSPPHIRLDGQDTLQAGRSLMHTQYTKSRGLPQDGVIKSTFIIPDHYVKTIVRIRQLDIYAVGVSMLNGIAYRLADNPDQLMLAARKSPGRNSRKPSFAAPVNCPATNRSPGNESRAAPAFGSAWMGNTQGTKTDRLSMLLLKVLLGFDDTPVFHTIWSIRSDRSPEVAVM